MIVTISRSYSISLLTGILGGPCSTAPDADIAAQHRGPAQPAGPPSPSVWLPELTAVIDPQRQQPPHTSQHPPSQHPPIQHHQHLDRSPKQQQQQQQQEDPALHDAYTYPPYEPHLPASLNIGSLTTPSPHLHQQLPQQLQPAPSSNQDPLAEAPTASSGVSDQQQHAAASLQMGLQAQGQQQGLSGNPQAVHGGRAGSQGGSSSSQPQQRDAAAQTLPQVRQQQMQTSERQAFSGATSSGG